MFRVLFQFQFSLFLSQTMSENFCLFWQAGHVVQLLQYFVLLLIIFVFVAGVFWMNEGYFTTEALIHKWSGLSCGWLAIGIANERPGIFKKDMPITCSTLPGLYRFWSWHIWMLNVIVMSIKCTLYNNTATILLINSKVPCRNMYFIKLAVMQFFFNSSI